MVALDVVTSMEFDTDAAFSDLVDRLADAASVDTVYGDPVERDGRTVIPVARVGWGFGGGGGSGTEEPPADSDEADSDEQPEATGEGFGMGGGLSAKPAGALEISDSGTRFVHYEDRKKLLATGVLAFLGGYLFKRW